MTETCNYRYPTSSCMNSAVSVKFRIDYNDKVYRVARCKQHDRASGYDTEAEALAAVIATKLTGEK